jgi:hypothetical protein
MVGTSEDSTPPSITTRRLSLHVPPFLNLLPLISSRVWLQKPLVQVLYIGPHAQSPWRFLDFASGPWQ